MRVVYASLLVGWVSLAIGQEARCPTSVFDAKTTIVDTKYGVEVTITTVDEKRVAEIRRRAGRLVEATHRNTASLGELDRCEVAVRYGAATAEEVDGGVRISLRADKPIGVQLLQSETHQRHQRVLDALAKPHATLLVDARSSSEVWIDGVDSGYQTPTDGILLPPGEHQVSVQDGAGNRSAPVTVKIARDRTQRLYLPSPK